MSIRYGVCYWFPSFETHKVKDGVTPEDIRKGIENKGKVDIVLQDDKGDTRIISGDKIDFKELGGVFKPLAEFVS